ncbi:toll/interleukin-1 receptor domain-containing protein [Enterobacter sp. 37]|nr:toll/interleukin-1 receptor domain-containing protein [Citrobacter freundii]
MFVSYTTRDNKLDIYSLKVIEAKIKKLGYSCYIDLLHNTSKNKQQRVFNELISSDYFMAIISDNYHLSPWAQKEITLARKLKKHIIKIDYRNVYKMQNNQIAIKQLVTRMKIKTLDLYSKLIYDRWYDHKFKNKHIAAMFLMCIDKRFLLVLLIISPMLFFSYQDMQSNIGALYLSITAAAIFYSLFNLYPEIYDKFRLGQNCYIEISQIKARRANLVIYLLGIDDNCFSDAANRFLTKQSYLDILSSLRFKNNFQVNYSMFTSLGLKFPLSGQSNKTFLEYCIKIAREDLDDIQKIKSIPDIHKLKLYDAIIYLERELIRFLDSSNKNTLHEGDVVAILIQAVDKLSYYSNKELPMYVGNRFTLHFTPTRDEIYAAKSLNTIYHEFT